MRCNNCGAEIDNGTINCPYCGCGVQGDGKPVTVYSAQVEDSRSEEEKRREEVFGENPFAGKDYSQPRKDLGLNWASFLGYFALWLGALANVANAHSIFTGEQYTIYNLSTDLVYSIYNGLKYADKFYGAALLLAALLCVVAAMSIIKFKALAVNLVPLISLYNAAIVVVYCILLTIILKHMAFGISEVISILVGLVMCVFTLITEDIFL